MINNITNRCEFWGVRCGTFPSVKILPLSLPLSLSVNVDCGLWIIRQLDGNFLRVWWTAVFCCRMWNVHISLSSYFLMYILHPFSFPFPSSLSSFLYIFYVQCKCVFLWMYDLRLMRGMRNGRVSPREGKMGTKRERNKWGKWEIFGMHNVNTKYTRLALLLLILWRMTNDKR